MNFTEKALSFRCHDSWLYGIISIPKKAITSRGVLIIVGGPQYRIGSHRQFTLLARSLAANGIAVMRFDVRGMGDSEGETITFEEIDDDLKCAINQFAIEIPFLQEIVLWGLCDAASAALFYAHQDERITGLVLVNPWVRTEQGAAKTYLKHYYLKRLINPNFWKKFLSNSLNYKVTIHSLFRNISTIFIKQNKSSYEQINQPTSLPERMFSGLDCFNGKILFIFSGNDLTAQEFVDLVKFSKKWQGIFESSRIKQLNLVEADHTFSRYEWRDQVFTGTLNWIKSY